MNNKSQGMRLGERERVKGRKVNLNVILYGHKNLRNENCRQTNR